MMLKMKQKHAMMMLKMKQKHADLSSLLGSLFCRSSIKARRPAVYTLTSAWYYFKPKHQHVFTYYVYIRLIKNVLGPPFLPLGFILWFQFLTHSLVLQSVEFSERLGKESTLIWKQLNGEAPQSYLRTWHKKRQKLTTNLRKKKVHSWSFLTMPLFPMTF